ncbi:MAG TPA: hypothetical protein VJ729_16575 [Nitrososphaeraceae archaeon]|nr:hypothetical protein [Nitrososphaeraceae archaeon]
MIKKFKREHFKSKPLIRMTLGELDKQYAEEFNQPSLTERQRQVLESAKKADAWIIIVEQLEKYLTGMNSDERLKTMYKDGYKESDYHNMRLLLEASESNTRLKALKMTDFELKQTLYYMRLLSCILNEFGNVLDDEQERRKRTFGV